MSLRVEIVDPNGGAVTASRILRAAWAPPCLDYSPEYLAWQFSFPGELQPVVALGILDGHPVGCASVTSRRFIFRGTHLNAYVLSFVAVDPIARGHGIAAAVYAALLESISPEAPVIAFAEPQSIGERLLMSAFDAASFSRRRLEPCRAFGYVRRPSIAASNACAVTAAENREDFLATIPAADNRSIWTHPTGDQLTHYASDPRPRVMMVIRNTGGVRIGSAMSVLADIVSAQGLQHVPMLESVFIASEHAGALAALFGFAADHFGSTATIVASNLSCLETSAIRAAGARAVPSLFNAYIFFKRRQAGFDNPGCVNLEVI